MTCDEREKLIRFSITVPEKLLCEFEKCCYTQDRDNRSEAVRSLMRNYIAAERWKCSNGEIFATITIVYDHHMPELMRKLTMTQHDFGDMILCSTHVHINHETCLECIITKGLSNQIQRFTETLKNIRGIKSVNVNVTSEI